MKRKQVYITEEIEAGLKALAKREQRTESDLIREALSEYLAVKRTDSDPWASLIASVPDGRNDESLRVDEVVYGRVTQTR